MSTEDRLADLEIQLAHQEDLVESLNRMVYLQQRKLDDLEALCAALARHLKDLRDVADSGSPANEKPPHY